MTTAMQVHTGEPGRQLERAEPRVGLLRPIATPKEVITSQEEARELVAQALKPDRDYGRIPGTGDKPTLLKPGAERLTLAFGLAAQFSIVEKEIDHDRVNTYLDRNGKEATSFGLYRYVIECSLVHRESGVTIGSAIASCSSLEKKYISRPRDSENTVIKMATKRAHVGATLNSLGLSEQFTQDVEDLADRGEQPAAAAESSSSSSAPAQDPAIDASCPKCGGAMWDNRLTKKSPKAPDFKCRDRSCDGVIWPPKPGEAPAAATSTSGGSATTSGAASSGSSTDAPRPGTLEWAMQLPLMGKPTSWAVNGTGYGKKPIGQCPASALKQARHFFVEKVTEEPNNERTPAMREQVQAIDLVLAELDTVVGQERLDLDSDVPQSPSPAPVAAGPIDTDEIPF